MSKPPKTPLGDAAAAPAGGEAAPQPAPTKKLTRQVEEDVNARLVSSFISPDLAAQIQQPLAGADIPDRNIFKSVDAAPRGKPVPVIIEFNVEFPDGVRQARELFFRMINADIREPMAGAAVYGLEGVFELEADETVNIPDSRETDRYAFATLAPETLAILAGLKASTRDRPALKLIYKVWRDPPLKAFVYESRRTIKADAAAMAFGANGEGIVWAVMDTGIDASHPHWRKYDNLTLPDGLRHRDFTTPYEVGQEDQSSAAALTDPDGHGTHVAGIIAGECAVGDALSASASPKVPDPADVLAAADAVASGRARGADRVRIVSVPTEPDSIQALSVIRKVRGETGKTELQQTDGPRQISGVAPKCKLVSLKVLKTAKEGLTSSLIIALSHVRRINNAEDDGRKLKIHGVNLSLGYPFEAEWYAAGHTPLCAEVDRLVRSGVMVVVAAGNAGYGSVATRSGGAAPAALPCTIADPGNAERALTVGSTHRDMPMTYGVSYFSAKGPTADGRMKPDLVAPGERIVSCAAGTAYADQTDPHRPLYREESGTSMAAPHVSGAAAAFMSIRVEYQKDPEALKALFCDSATSLNRTDTFQGKGLIDLMRAIQKV